MCWLSLVALLVAAPEEVKISTDPLATLRPGHPRLFLLDAQLDKLRTTVRTDPVATRWHQRLTTEAKKLLDAPPTKFEIVGPRLLGASRSVLGRVALLGLLYRLDGNEACGRRAVAELVAAAGWPKWNPSHFLDTAELNNAFGIGWDWLQPLLGKDRQAILDGWLRNGIEPARAAYRTGTNGGWQRATHNWNQVCNGGNTVAALALATEQPELAREILRAALASVPRAMASYAPDGGWNEGPGYWNYATSYNTYLLAALDTALGTDFGLSKLPGFHEAGDFRVHFVGPSGETFNYADAGAGAGSAPCLFWLAKRFDKPLYGWQERTLSRGEPFDLVWFDPRATDPEQGGVPLCKRFHGVDVGFLRGSWSDPSTTWLAFKGGDNRANHSHLDLGCFVLDALGQRWFSDLGGDDYNLPAYFGNKRWTYYRLRTEGQNTLVIDDANQKTDAKAPLLGFVAGGERPLGVVDLTKAWPMCTRVHRGFALLGKRDVLLQDEIHAKEPVRVVWGAHTYASIKADGHKAVLERGGKQFHVTLLAPADARLVGAPVEIPAPQRPAKGLSKLTVVLPDKTTDVRIALLCSPVADAPAPRLEPLAKWVER